MKVKVGFELAEWMLQEEHVCRWTIKGVPDSLLANHK